jgi:hypothetical protein
MNRMTPLLKTMTRLCDLGALSLLAKSKVICLSTQLISAKQSMDRSYSTESAIASQTRWLLRQFNYSLVVNGTEAVRKVLL